MASSIRARVAMALPPSLKAVIKACSYSITAPSFLSSRHSRDFVAIMGSQRSGTTLLFLMLTAHPRILGLDENESKGTLPSWITLLRNSRRGCLTCYKLPTETEEVELFARSYPDTRTIWVIRNPLSVVSSMRQLKVGKGTWLSTLGRFELRKLTTIFPQISQLDVDQLDDIAIGALLWKYKQRAIEVYRSYGLNVHEVRYEDILESPRQALAAVLGFIGVDWSDNVLNHEQHHDPRREHPGGTRADRPLDATRKQPTLALSGEEIARVEAVCREEMESFGYS
jgi:protein-tyrosine sulfotransferase